MYRCRTAHKLSARRGCAAPAWWDRFGAGSGFLADAGLQPTHRRPSLCLTVTKRRALAEEEALHFHYKPHRTAKETSNIAKPLAQRERQAQSFRFQPIWAPLCLRPVKAWHSRCFGTGALWARSSRRRTHACVNLNLTIALSEGHVLANQRAHHTRRLPDISSGCRHLQSWLLVYMTSLNFSCLSALWQMKEDNF